MMTNRSSHHAIMASWRGVVLAMALGVLSLVGFMADSWARPLDLNDRPSTFSNIRPPTDPATDPRSPYYDASGTQGAFYFFANPNKQAASSGYMRNAAFESLCENGDITSRIVACVTRVIDEAVLTFLEEFSAQLTAVIVATIVLSMLIFGTQMLTGSVDEPQQAAFMLALKIGGVILFTNGAFGGFFVQIFPAMESLAGYAMSFVSQDDTSVITMGCSTNPDPTISIWDRVDCILRRLFIGGRPTILSDIDIAASQGGAGVLWILAVAIFWTNFLGILIFFTMLTTFVTLFLLVVRCMYVFLACYCYLALLIVVSPLIIPLILFRNTKQYFDKWFRQFMGMIIQPMILFAFMAFFFALLDQLFFINNGYSLMSILGIDWESPRVSAMYDDEGVAAKMESFENETGYPDDSEEYRAYEMWLRQYSSFNGVGDVDIEDKPLLELEIHIPDNLPGGVVVGSVANALEGLANWGLENLSKYLFPFKVPKVVPHNDRDVMSLFWEIFKFFIVMALLLPLMNKFAQDIPRLMQFLSGARRTPGAVMPGERQVMGAIGAAKGATVGAVKGAVKGAIIGVKGGPKGIVAGAAKGAAKGAAQGAVKGYQQEGGANAGGKKRSTLSLSDSKQELKGGKGEKAGDGSNPMHNQHLGDWGGMRGLEKQARKYVADKKGGGGKGGGLDKLKDGGKGGGEGGGEGGAGGGGIPGGGGGLPGGGGGGMPGGGGGGGLGGGGGGMPGGGGGGGLGGGGGGGGLGGAGGAGGAGGIPVG